MSKIVLTAWFNKHMIRPMEHNVTYESLIELEESKIRLMEKEIVECRRRIDVLKSFIDEDKKSILAVATIKNNILGVATIKNKFASIRKYTNLIEPKPHHPDIVFSTTYDAEDPKQSEGFEDPKRGLSKNVVSMLWFVGSEGKSLDDICHFCETNGFEHNRGSVRSIMSTYKIRHGFIYSKNPGFFSLTRRGLEFLTKNYPQSETPSVGAEGVSDTSIQAAVEGGPESDGLI